VRRNAVLAIHALCKLPKGDLLVPDADEHIERFLAQEQDVSAKRNALVMLTHHAQVCFCVVNIDSVCACVWGGWGWGWRGGEEGCSAGHVGQAQRTRHAHTPRTGVLLCGENR
jgi:hypothetical protein